MDAQQLSLFTVPRLTHWRCEQCGLVMPTESLIKNDHDETACPQCKQPDVFPFRLFRCTKCGVRGDQQEFFDPDMPGDGDPVEERWERECEEETDGHECGSTTYEQLPIPPSMTSYQRVVRQGDRFRDVPIFDEDD